VNLGVILFHCQMIWLPFNHFLFVQKSVF